MQLTLAGMEDAVAPPSPAPGPRAAAGAVALSVPELSEAAGRYLLHAHAQRTLEAYRRDWERFEGFCRQQGLSAMPCAPQTLALYLTALAEEGKATSSIRRVRIAIAKLHLREGHPRPDEATCVRDVERGIRRRHGTAQKQARPLLPHELKKMVLALSNSPRDLRDRAVLLLGFAGGFRRAELVALDVADVQRDAQGLLVRLVKSKTDRWGKGEYTALPPGVQPETCPVRAFDRYLEVLQTGTSGTCTQRPLFCASGRGAHHHRLCDARMPAGQVGRLVQRAAALAGLEASAYSSHSLRAGLATSAYLAGASLEDIQRQGRWSSRSAMLRYVRVAADFGPRNAARGLL